MHIENGDSSYYSFKGIPYAEPPVGKLRFQSPLKHKGWSGVRNASTHGSFCANKYGYFGLTQTVGGTEDCLFANVYTPALSGERAVMFFIHGGAFMSGNGDTLMYGPQLLVREDVVLVTINHRYSALGFLSTADGNAPGNQGLKDIVVALKWVRDNIRKFGGDPEKITVFGHSAGSVAAHMLLMSPMADGLFHQVILQSGTSLMECLFQRNNPRALAEKLANTLGLTYSSTAEMIDKLQKVDISGLIDAETNLFVMDEPWALRSFEFVPSVEPKSSSKNTFFDERPIDLFIKGKYRNVPMMTGGPTVEGMFVALILQDEATLKHYNQHADFIVPLSFELMKNFAKMNETIDALRKLYFGGRSEGTLKEWQTLYTDGIFKFSSDRAVRFHADTSTHPIYYYEFAFDGNINFFKRLLHLNFDGAAHGDELFYLFEPDLPGYAPDANATLVRRRMVKMWTNFAKFG